MEGNEPAKVTALCFDAVKHVLISSGDDGYLRMWDPGTWDTRRGGADIKPINQINFNAWVTPELKGITIKMDDKELEKANPKRGKPAAAHSSHVPVAVRHGSGRVASRNRRCCRSRGCR